MERLLLFFFLSTALTYDFPEYPIRSTCGHANGYCLEGVVCDLKPFCIKNGTTWHPPNYCVADFECISTAFCNTQDSKPYCKCVPGAGTSNVDDFCQTTNDQNNGVELTDDDETNPPEYLDKEKKKRNIAKWRHAIYKNCLKSTEASNSNDGKDVCFKGHERVVAKEGVSWYRITLQGAHMLEIVNFSIIGAHAAANKNIQIRLNRYFLRGRSIDVEGPDTQVCLTTPGPLKSATLMYCERRVFGNYVTVIQTPIYPDASLDFCEFRAYGAKLVVNAPGQPCQDGITDGTTIPILCKVFMECVKEQNSQSGVCRIPLGVHCNITRDNGDFCKPPGKCYNSKCGIPPFGSCAEEFRDSCLNGSYCDKDNVCRIMFYAPCKFGELGCFEGGVCDYTGVCKLAQGSVCEKDEDCTLDATCDDSKICKCRNPTREGALICGLPMGAPCDGKMNTFCNVFTICDWDDVCRLRVGEACNAITSSYCKDGSICDISGRCKYPYQEACVDSPQCVIGAFCTKPDKVCNCSREPLDDISCALLEGYSCAGNRSNACTSKAFCDKKDNVCKLPLHSDCDPNIGFCEDGAVCDYFNLCKKVVGENCTLDDECVAGAFCRNGTLSLCACSHASRQVGRICAPVEGRATGHCRNGTCIDDNADCVGTPKSGSCQCRTPIIKPYYRCTGSKRCSHPMDCNITTSICQDRDTPQSECKLIVNQACPNDTDCRRELVCENGLCKLKLGDLCQNPSECISEAECLEENGEKRCRSRKRKAGGPCDPNEGDEACEDPQAKCIDNICKCNEGYVINPDLTCKKALGSDCQTSQDCADGTICDPETSKCKVMIGGKCKEDSDCTFKTICDLAIKPDPQCRVDLEDHCKGDRTYFCRSDTVCDVTKRCRRPVGYRCTGDKNECVAGGDCIDGFCTCDPVSTNTVGFICVKLAGIVYGFCLPGARCLDPKAFCDDLTFKCFCQAGIPTDSSGYWCATPAPAKELVRTSSIVPVLIAILVTLILLTVITAVIIAIKRQQVEKTPSQQSIKRDSVVSAQESTPSKESSSEASEASEVEEEEEPEPAPIIKRVDKPQIDDHIAQMAFMMDD